MWTVRWYAETDAVVTTSAFELLQTLWREPYWADTRGGVNI